MDSKEALKACPFCQRALVPASRGDWKHPIGGGAEICFLDGLRVVPATFDLWNTRSSLCEEERGELVEGKDGRSPSLRSGSGCQPSASAVPASQSGIPNAGGLKDCTCWTCGQQWHDRPGALAKLTRPQFPGDTRDGCPRCGGLYWTEIDDGDYALARRFDTARMRWRGVCGLLTDQGVPAVRAGSRCGSEALVVNSLAEHGRVDCRPAACLHHALASAMSAGTAETPQEAQGEARQRGPAKQETPDA